MNSRLRFLLAPIRFLRCRPRTSLVVGMVLSAALALNLWAWYHYRAAEQALRDDSMDEARQHVAQCLRVWRLSSTVHLLAAYIERLSGHYLEAEQHLKECERLNGGATEATQLEQLLIRAQSGKLSEVEAGLWQYAEQGHPERAHILEALALGRIGESRMGMALACLDKLVECDPLSARALHWRGWVHKQIKSFSQAEADYRRAVELAPARWGTRLNLVRLLLDESRTQEARPHLEELMRSRPEEPNVRVAQARCLQQEGKGEEAIAVLDQILSSHPHHAEALNVRCQLTCQWEPPATAETWLRRALRERSLALDPGILYLFQECLKKQGKAREAEQAMNQFKTIIADTHRLEQLGNEGLSRMAHNPDLLAEFGSLLLRLGDEKKGLSFLYRALDEDPSHRPAHEALLHYFESRDEKDKAAKHRDYLRRLQSLSAPDLSRTR